MEINKVDFFDYYTYQVYEKLRRYNRESTFITNKFITEIHRNVDLYTEEGVKSQNLQGNTIIYVIQNLNFSQANRIISDFDVCKNKYNFLVVYFKRTISEVLNIDKEDDKTCKYISFEKLAGRSTESKTSNENFYKERNKEKKWEERRSNLMDEARKIINDENNALFLGAGVSASANMPSWDKLLQSIMGDIQSLKPDTLSAFKQLNTHVYEQCGDSNLIMARYLEKAISLNKNKEVFTSIIQKHLYSKEHKSELLSILANIVKEKKVDEVITYNFDDILEQELEKIGAKQSKDFTSISKDAEISEHNKLPIYHVHGIIPEKGPTDENVVFTEEEYHNRYKEVYHWSNIEQLHAMSRKHCFFIGLSMVDPNLRRLLDISRRINTTNTIGHFAFLRRIKLENYCLSNINNSCRYIHVSESLIDKKKQADIYALNYGVLESMFNDLGVNVIWFEEFSELPGLIADIFNIKNKTLTKMRYL